LNASHLFLYRYTLPLTEPVTVRGHRITGREGIIIALTFSDEDITAYGEIAPLPGLHTETIDMAEAQLVELLYGKSFTGKDPLTAGIFPSVQTGLEMAVLNARSLISGNPPSIFPETGGSDFLPLNALLFGDAHTVEKKAETMFTLGYRVFKLKVDSGNALSAAESVCALHRRFGSSIELRLDANQSFRLDDAVSFAAHLPEGSVSYIEEPLQDASALGEFHARTSIRSALDETLWQRPGLMDTLPGEALKALILKPNRLGGIETTRRMIRMAEQNGLQPVLSSAFESGISLGMYSWIAASASRNPAACGLDTFRYLCHDLIETPFGSGNSMIDARKAFFDAQKVNPHYLKLLSIWTL
jgi:o-succinylbenzoate synthase